MRRWVILGALATLQLIFNAATVTPGLLMFGIAAILWAAKVALVYEPASYGRLPAFDDAEAARLLGW